MSRYTADPVDIYTSDDLSQLVVENRIRKSLVIRGEHLFILDGINEVHGNLGLSDSALNSLGMLKVVKGDFWISCYEFVSELESLCDLEIVGGNLSLRYSSIRDLGKLRRVAGNVGLRDSPIETLGMLEYVGGSLHLPKRFEGCVDLSKIEVRGAVKYWNDAKNPRALRSRELGLQQSDRPVPYWRHEYIYKRGMPLVDGGIEVATVEQVDFYEYFRDSFLNGCCLSTNGNSNYYFVLMFDLMDMYPGSLDLEGLRRYFKCLVDAYPGTRRYAHRLIQKAEEREGKFEAAWQTIVESGRHVSNVDLYRFQELLGRNLFEGSLIAQIAGISHLTSFGQSNVEEIYPFAVEQLARFESDSGKHILSCLYKGISRTDETRNYRLKTQPNPFYRRFFDTESEFKYWNSLDEQQSKAGYERSLRHVPEKALSSLLRRFLRQGEDAYRESIGMPKVGEGWISETELFYKIKTQFPQVEVIQHGRPSWLGQQSMDIYMPSITLGVEYQGVQHFRPVSLFGGDSALEKNIERDNRKMQLAAANGCSIVYVYEGYQFDDVRDLIEERIEGKKSSIEFKHVNRPREAEHLLNFSKVDGETYGDNK